MVFEVQTKRGKEDHEESTWNRVAASCEAVNELIE